jgi:hypothetical protein
VMKEGSFCGFVGVDDCTSRSSHDRSIFVVHVSHATENEKHVLLNAMAKRQRERAGSRK